MNLFQLLLPLFLALHPPTVDALAVLHAWDERRATAWARGQPAALSELYVEGSRTGRADRRLLASYADRGLRVTGMRVQVLAASLVSMTPTTLTLTVTDRLVGAVAMAGDRRVVLPRDDPSTRVIVLRRVAGEWLVAEVADQRSPAASTASTSRSWNW